MITWIIVKKLIRFLFVPTYSEVEQYRCEYTCRKTPRLRFWGKENSIISYERDGEHIYVSILVQNGFVVHFLMYFDNMWDLFFFEHAVETFERMSSMSIKEGLYARLYDVNPLIYNFTNVKFKLEDILNREELGIDERIFAKIAKAQEVAVAAVVDDLKQAQQKQALDLKSTF